jgi:hypothetical protein
LLPFSPDYGFILVAAMPVRESWQGDGAARQIAATSKGEGRPCLQSCHLAVAFSLQLQHMNSLLQSVFVHAVLGADGPRWQPLNGADCHALLARGQSESVLAGGNGDSGRQLRSDGGGARPSAGKWPAVAMAERLRFSMTMDSKLIMFTRIYISLIFGPFI